MSWEDILKKNVSDTLEIDPNNPLYLDYSWDEKSRPGRPYPPAINPERDEWENKSLQVLNVLSNEQPYWIHLDDNLWFSDEHNIKSIFRNANEYQKHLNEMIRAGILEMKTVQYGKAGNMSFYQPPGSNLHKAPQD